MVRIANASFSATSQCSVASHISDSCDLECSVGMYLLWSNLVCHTYAGSSLVCITQCCSSSQKFLIASTLHKDTLAAKSDEVLRIMNCDCGIVQNDCSRFVAHTCYSLWIVVLTISLTTKPINYQKGLKTNYYLSPNIANYSVRLLHKILHGFWNYQVKNQYRWLQQPLSSSDLQSVCKGVDLLHYQLGCTLQPIPNRHRWKACSCLMSESKHLFMNPRWL